MDTGQAREDDRPSSQHRGGSGGTGSHEEEEEGEVHEGKEGAFQGEERGV